MRDAIARALLWVLSVLPWTRRSNPGHHSASFLAECIDPVPVSPWSEPWTGPTKEEAQELFRQQAESTMELNLTRQHRQAVPLPEYVSAR